MTAVAYELGWDFVSLVEGADMTFTKFCQDKTRIYKSSCTSSSRSFLGENAFIEFWFQWAGCQNIDFRQKCEWCGWNPKYLSCDGTQLGIPLGKLKIDPINEFKAGEPIKPAKDSRLDRCFLANPLFGNAKKGSQMRSHLDYCARKQLSKLDPNDLKSDEEEMTLKEELADNFPPECKGLLLDFLNQQFKSSTKVVESAAKVFHLLSYEACITAFLPTSLCDQLESVLDFGDLYNHRSNIKKCNVKLATLISDAKDEDQEVQQHICKLVRYIMARVKELKDISIPPENALPIPDSYNPPQKGRWYYFNEKGQQLRETRQFSKDTKAASTTYDDVPEGKHCTKSYPKPSDSAPSYIFFFLCPLHGHCYGGHIINGKEGRKDPSAALYTHMAKAPDVLLYDFACSMEEYNLNRESGFWINTRIYHDIFHGCRHICSPMYKLDKKEYDMMSFNTSISEQFNSHIKCIKPSAEHMTQHKFVFFVQFFTNRWNKKKLAKTNDLISKAEMSSV